MLFRVLDDKVRVPYRMIFAYTEVAKRTPDTDAGVIISELYEELYDMQLTPAQLEQVASRLQAWAAEAKARAAPAASNVTKIKQNSNTFSHRYNEWFKDLSLDRTLLWLSDYDPQKALYFYSEIDKDLIDMAVEAKAKNTEELNRIEFEAALFGNGGSYGKGKKGVGGSGPEGTVREHDCTKISGNEILSRLNALSRR